MDDNAELLMGHRFGDCHELSRRQEEDSRLLLLLLVDQPDKVGSEALGKEIGNIAV
jgi:hypothetical protein